MSKYHAASGLMASKHDWMTPDDIAAGLQDKLELRGYWTEFQVLRNGMPIDEESARQIIIGMVTSPPIIEKYQSSLQRMNGDADNREAIVEATQTTGGLRFKHGSYGQLLTDFGEFNVISKGTLKDRLENRTKAEEKAEERATALDAKHRDIQSTSNDDYLIHANQTGYLLKNVRLDFLRSPKMQGTSVKMRIRDLTLDQLRRFVDAAGHETLASLSTHEGTQPGLDDYGQYIYSGWIGFATEVIDFLNLETVIDIGDIKSQHRDIGGDTGFRPLSEWGGTVEAAIDQLAERRPDIDVEDIRYWFMEGYGGELLYKDTDEPQEATTDNLRD